MNLFAATASPADELSERAQQGFFQQAYYEHLHDMFESNPQITEVLTIVGICLVGLQCWTFIYQISKRGIKGALMFSPLIGGILLSTMLIMPTVMMPFMLSIIDWFLGLIAAVIGQGSG